MIVDVETSASVRHRTQRGAFFGGVLADALRMLGNPNGGQIDLHVVGNRFDAPWQLPSTNGCSLTRSPAAILTADIYNNSIWDIARKRFRGIFINPVESIHARHERRRKHH
jgi:hypothetical protein